MALSSNFTGVALGVDPDGKQALLVSGVSVPSNEATAIFVAVPHGGELLWAAAVGPTLTDWHATIAPKATPFKPKKEILVVGVAMRLPPHDPFVWQSTFKIAEKTIF